MQYSNMQWATVGPQHSTTPQLKWCKGACGSLPYPPLQEEVDMLRPVQRQERVHVQEASHGAQRHALELPVIDTGSFLLPVFCVTAAG